MHVTTTISATTTISTSTSTTVNTASGYVIVSPSPCPLSSPAGAVIGESDAAFSAANGGLQYHQYANAQYIIQNATSGPLFVDLSSSNSVSISDANGDTLIIYANGTFEAFASTCEISVVGSGPVAGSSRKAKKDTLKERQSSSFCTDLKAFCNSPIGVALIALASNRFCIVVAADIGADILGGLGFLTNVLGPEVGLPATIGGVILGAKIGTDICAVATALIAYGLCNACPSPTKGGCGFGTLSCNGKPCQDILSDPNNCGACGNVVRSSFCIHPFKSDDIEHEC